MLGLGYRPIATFDEIQERRARLGSVQGTGSTTSPRSRSGPDLGLGPGARPFAATTDARSRAVTTDRTQLPRQAAARVGVDYNGGATQQASPMVKYLSKEWVAEGRRLAEQDERLIDATRGMRASILCVVQDAPDHADEVFYIEFDDGRLGDLLSGSRSEHAELIGDATIQIEGDYGIFCRVQEGHLSQKAAVMRGLLRFRGSKLAALRYMRALEELTRVLRRVPTEF